MKNQELSILGPCPCRLSWLIIIMAVIFVISQFSSPHIIDVKRCKCDNVGSCLYFTPRCIKYIKSDTKARPRRGTLCREDTIIVGLGYAGQGTRQPISSHEKGLSLLKIFSFFRALSLLKNVKKSKLFLGLVITWYGDSTPLWAQNFWDSWWQSFQAWTWSLRQSLQAWSLSQSFRAWSLSQSFQAWNLSRTSRLSSPSSTLPCSPEDQKRRTEKYFSGRPVTVCFMFVLWVYCVYIVWKVMQKFTGQAW